MMKVKAGDGQTGNILNIRVHQNGLLSLHEIDEFEINDQVRPVCLPKPNILIEPGVGLISSFSDKTHESSPVFTTVHIMFELVRSKTESGNQIPEIRLTEYTDLNCSSYSSGFLFLKIDQKWTVVGLIKSCSDNSVIFTNISAYINFINLNE